MLHSRREFLKLSSLLTLSGSLPLLQSCSDNSHQGADSPLKIGYLPITDATPMLIAHQQELFSKRGIQVDKPVLFRSWAQLVEAFLSGQVNLIHVLSPISVWLRYGSQAPAKTLMWNHVGGSALTVAPQIKQVSDLSGTTVAIPFWYSIHNVVLQHILRKNGLSVSTKGARKGAVNLVVMPPSDMVAALASNKISGFIVAEPFNALAESKGVGQILRFTSDVWKDHACCVTLMQEQQIKQRPNWVQKIVDALVEAQIWLQTHRTESVQLLAKTGKQHYTPHSEDVLNRVLSPNADALQNYIKTGAIKHPNWQQQRIDFQPYPYASYTQQLIELLKITQVAGQNRFLQNLDPASAAKELVDERFVKTALEQQNGFEIFNLPKGLTRTEQIEV